MRLEQIQEYCMEKLSAYESMPFGDDLICYRVSGKIFAQLSLKPEWNKMTLKCNPDSAEFYRQAYPGVVVRGYHCPPVQQPYWNTIDLAGLPDEVLQQMIDEAYEEVVKKLTKKEKSYLKQRENKSFVSCDGSSKDFIQLCKELDQELNDLVGGKKQKEVYDQYNTLDQIKDAIVIYEGENLLGGGAFRFYDQETVELKRIFIRPEYRGQGLAKELIRRLEAQARIQGFRFGILETSKVLQSAIELYKKCGYQIIPNYGGYANLTESVCMSKKL